MKNFIVNVRSIVTWKSLVAMSIGSLLVCINFYFAALSGDSLEGFLDSSKLIFPVSLAIYIFLGIPIFAYLDRRKIESFLGYATAGALCCLLPSILFLIFIVILTFPQILNTASLSGNLMAFVWFVFFGSPASVLTGILCATVYWSICVSRNRLKGIILVTITMILPYAAYSYAASRVAVG